MGNSANSVDLSSGRNEYEKTLIVFATTIKRGAVPQFATLSGSFKGSLDYYGRLGHPEQGAPQPVWDAFNIVADEALRQGYQYS